MAIVNQSKPTTSLTNTSRISIGETWSSIPTTWATETRTWAMLVSLITNVIAGGMGLIWTVKRFPWLEATPWLTEGGITNISKP
jgi:hypothetical protein